MYLAHYDDKTGCILGFYIPGMHRDIPVPTMEITNEQHVDFFARGQRHKVVNKVWTYVEPAAPSIDVLKEQAWQEVKAKRDALEQAGAPYLNKVLDSDEKSVTRITVAVQAAQAAIASNTVNFALNWTMQDNTVVTLTAAQVCGMAVALAAHSDALHKTARDLRTKIEAATSAEELAAIKWPE